MDEALDEHEMIVLDAIATAAQKAKPPLSADTIGRYTSGMSKTDITSAVARLHSQGLVAGEKGDGELLVSRLTDEGRRMAEYKR